MKKIYRKNVWVGLFIVWMLGLGQTAVAKENDCWVDFYEYAEFIGDHLRLEGPLKMANLRDVQGQNWERKIDSLIVGPKAKVTLYENANFKLTLTEMAKHPDLMKSLGITEQEILNESELTFGPNQKINHLGVHNFHKKTKSLKIDCID